MRSIHCEQPAEDAVDGALRLHRGELAALRDEGREAQPRAPGGAWPVATGEAQHDRHAGGQVATGEQRRAIGGQLGEAPPAQEQAMDRQPEQRHQR
jgi:hypothetical protein